MRLACRAVRSWRGKHVVSVLQAVIVKKVKYNKTSHISTWNINVEPVTEEEPMKLITSNVNCAE